MTDSTPSSTNSCLHLERASVLGALGLAASAAITQQVLFVSLASLSLSFGAGLNLINRQRFLATSNQVQHSDLTHLTQTLAETQAEIATLTAQITENQDALSQLSQTHQEQQLGITALTRQNQVQHVGLDTYTQQHQAQQEQLEALKEDLQELQQCFNEKTRTLQLDMVKLAYQETQTADVVQQLQAIDQLTQAIQSTPEDANLYYQRGLTRMTLERNDDYWIAIDDFSRTLELQPKHPDALLKRGLLRAKLAAKQLAVSDFRAAAQLYFEQGDLTNYQHATQLSHNQHEQGAVSSPDPVAQASEPQASEPQESEPQQLEGLFS